jgi:hypothetical protein
MNILAITSQKNHAPRKKHPDTPGHFRVVAVVATISRWQVVDSDPVGSIIGDQNEQYV